MSDLNRVGPIKDNHRLSGTITSRSLLFFLTYSFHDISRFQRRVGRAIPGFNLHFVRGSSLVYSKNAPDPICIIANEPRKCNGILGGYMLTASRSGHNDFLNFLPLFQKAH